MQKEVNQEYLKKRDEAADTYKVQSLDSKFKDSLLPYAGNTVKIIQEIEGKAFANGADWSSQFHAEKVKGLLVALKDIASGMTDCDEEETHRCADVAEQALKLYEEAK